MKQTCILPILALAFALNAPAAEHRRTLLDKKLLLGPEKTEWDHFRGQTAQPQFETVFALENSELPCSILVRQMDVKADGWIVSVNDQKVGVLQLIDEPAWIVVPVRAGVLKKGENKLRIANPALKPGGTFSDQVEIGTIHLLERENVFSSNLEISVRGEDKELLPARITITDLQGNLAALTNLSGEKVAARTGILYTSDGKAAAGLLPGDYRVFATRGSEYSLGETKVTLKPGQKNAASLLLKREVPTPGYVAADTHIHTFTHSRHGDATADERVSTIAGEGIELPVVTEHNLHVTYAAPASRLGVGKYFTLVQGNEVTTKRGHFNIFPVELSAPVPDAKIEDWSQLLRSIRATPQVQVVILNHPSDVHSGFIPFASTNLLPGIGRSPTALDFSVDAIEVINSGAMRSDWMEPFRGWFALLNYGHKIMAVSGSDSHDVSRFSLGQGRTYIPADDSDPSSIDIARACSEIKAGRAFISLGLFAKILVNGKYSMGDLVPAGKSFQVDVEVLGPGWIAADKVELFANGQKVAEATAEAGRRAKLQKIKASWQLPPAVNDAWLVAIASGPGVQQPYWTIPRPYQPSTTNAKSPSLAATNPVWLDCDGDGKFTPPRFWAEQVLAKGFTEESIRKLERADPAALLQAVDLLSQAKPSWQRGDIDKALEKAAPSVRAAFGLN